MYRIIDLFAGIGGIRKGFELASKNRAKCVFTSEIDKYAIETYKANFGLEEVCGDITKITASEIRDHDILLAGFPCQPFSQAGLKKGFSETRGTLFFDIARILDEKRPQAFLLENVKGLAGHDKGNTLRTILKVLREDLNYNVPEPKILRARDFGVPQNRERLFIAGFRDKKVKFEFPLPSGKKVCVGDILMGVADEKYTISDSLWKGHKRRKKMHEEKGNGFGYSLFNAESPYTNTISARYYKDGSEILIEQKGKNPRKLTPRECANLQGYPKDFVIPVSDTQAYKQFGNSVAVPVIKAIAERMLPHIREYKAGTRPRVNS